MVKIAAFSAQGGRDYNEDSISVLEEADRQCAVVADGLGGHGGGEIASSIAAVQIKNAFSSATSVNEEWILELYRQINKEVLGQQSIQCQMKTTCVSLFLEQDIAWWAHVGDSRLYYFENGELKMKTMDHSVSQMAVLSGEITAEQIRFHEDRNRVLRAFGAGEDVRPDIDRMKLNPDIFQSFLLCTDGFWEYVLETEMQIDLLKAEQPSEWLKYMEERLNRRVDGKNDNYSAVAVFYGNDPVERS